MSFAYNEKKAAQAAAYLMKLNGGTVDSGCLIKMLYLADRLALLEAGAPITGDKMMSLPHGPVLSRICDLARFGPESDATPWGELISSNDETHTLKLRSNVLDPDELSDFEIDVLERIYEQFGNMAFSELRAFTHELPEWKDPCGSAHRILVSTVLRSEGVPENRIIELKKLAYEEWFFESLRARGA